jgi:hypothetical protein
MDELRIRPICDYFPLLQKLLHSYDINAIDIFGGTLLHSAIASLPLIPQQFNDQAVSFIYFLLDNKANKYGAVLDNDILNI